mmetsp:Transcript_40085/g.115628  ORF Transcript_40085/g.115628 Transcript_40085/m.115628 type:complete len:312 (+) Transcript_40085:267-1202(+)
MHSTRLAVAPHPRRPQQRPLQRGAVHGSLRPLGQPEPRRQPVARAGLARRRVLPAAQGHDLPPALSREGHRPAGRPLRLEDLRALGGLQDQERLGDTPAADLGVAAAQDAPHAAELRRQLRVAGNVQGGAPAGLGEESHQVWPRLLAQGERDDGHVRVLGEGLESGGGDGLSRLFWIAVREQDHCCRARALSCGGADLWARAELLAHEVQGGHEPCAAVGAHGFHTLADDLARVQGLQLRPLAEDLGVTAEADDAEPIRFPRPRERLVQALLQQRKHLTHGAGQVHHEHQVPRRRGAGRRRSRTLRACCWP